MLLLFVRLQDLYPSYIRLDINGFSCWGVWLVGYEGVILLCCSFDRVRRVTGGSLSALFLQEFAGVLFVSC